MKREIGYVWANIDKENDYLQTDIDKFREFTGTIVTKLAHGIDATWETMKSLEDKLWQQQIHQLKPPPKNNHQQPDIVPPDIMDIDTVTESTTATCILTTALSTTASKTRSKMVQFNAIVDVNEIDCNSKLRMKTAKTNKQKLENSDNNKFGDHPLWLEWFEFCGYVRATVPQTCNQIFVK